MSKQEEWRDIPGYEGFYQVSNTGKIRNVPGVLTIQKGASVYSTGTELTQHISRKYQHVILAHPNLGKKGYFVHRLVADVFHPNNENLPQVNHIDGDKLNNNADNLEWVTCSQNIQHAFDTGLKVAPKGEDTAHAKLTNSQVVEARRRSKAGEYQKDIAKDMGVRRTLISTAVNGTYYKNVDNIESPFAATERRPFGFAHACSKFNKEQVAEIKQAVLNGESRAKVAERYGVERHTIEKMCRGKTYTDDELGNIHAPKTTYKKFDNPKCPISIDQMPKIIDMRQNGETLDNIAKQYHTDRHVIKRWIGWYNELKSGEKK